MSVNEGTPILVIHGPNMNLVGKRSGEEFGTLTLDKIDRRLRRKADSLGATLKIFQSNEEGAIIKRLQRQRSWTAGILLNPGALCFSSYTLLDTLQLINLPAVEVHLTGTLAGREVKESLFREYCLESVHGPPDEAYLLGLEKLVIYLNNSQN